MKPFLRVVFVAVFVFVVVVVAAVVAVVVFVVVVVVAVVVVVVAVALVVVVVAAVVVVVVVVVLRASVLWIGGRRSWLTKSTADTQEPGNPPRTRPLVSEKRVGPKMAARRAPKFGQWRRM